MPVLSADHLRGIARGMVAALGAPSDEALLIADSLVDSNLAGHDSHGVLRLEQYARMVRDGNIVPGAPTNIVHETAAAAVINGNWNFGQVVAFRAVEIGVRKAREAGSAVVSVRNANHLGRLGEFTLKAAHDGVIAIAGINN